MCFLFFVVANVPGRKFAYLFPVVEAVRNVVERFPRVTLVCRKIVGSRSHGRFLAECEDY